MAIAGNKRVNPRIVYVTIIMLAVISLIAIGSSAVLYRKYTAARNDGQAEARQLVARLARTIDLPEVPPTVVTVTDKSRLGSQQLAARVANQDMLLIYGAAKRIIVYRPSTGKVIDMLSFDGPTPAQSAVPPADVGVPPARPANR